MKSEKARQELEDGSWRVEVGDEGEDVDLPYHAVRVDVAQYAVELAEQEAEETFNTPRQAFAALIDKVSGRGTWDRNPWVVVYEFELVK